MNKIVNWFKAQLSNPQVVFLALLMVVIVLVLSYAGNMLAPVLASIVIAYLLHGLVVRLEMLKLPRMIAVWLVFASFIFFLVSVVLGLLPILYNQLTEAVQQIPNMLSHGQEALMNLPEHYPELVSIAQVQEFIASIRAQLTEQGQQLITSSLSGAASLISMVVYVILLPILVFFFLKDKDMIIGWISSFLPHDKDLAIKVWYDVDAQIGNYVRGKFWEIVIVWLVSYITFSFLGLSFAILLAALVGVSVLMPYVGAAVVTIPIVAIGWVQWGWSGDFVTLVIAYLVIQALDGNLLAPLLFSEVVNLHPVAIIVAILFFGGLWGIWGVFFAIPLATLVQAIIVAWPKVSE